MKKRKNLPVDVLLFLLAALLLPAFGEAADGNVVYNVPPPKRAIYHEDIQNIFQFADAPFGSAFSDIRTFFAPASRALYFFARYNSSEYTIIGDGSYKSPREMIEEEMGVVIGPGFKRTEAFTARLGEIRDGTRTTTDPAEMLVYFRRMAERRWNKPDIMDFKKNGGEQYVYIFKDAVVTTKRALLPDTPDGTLGTHLEFHIDSDALWFGTRFVDVSENALYFVCGPRVVKIGTIEFSPRSVEEIFASLDDWRSAIIKANGDMR